MIETQPLAGRAAIAAGGALDIGRAVALALAEELAATVRFLCPPEAACITGQTINVNGGGYLP